MAGGWTEANPIWRVFPVWWKLAVAVSLVPLIVWRRPVAVGVNTGLALIVVWNASWLCVDLVAGGPA